MKKVILTLAALSAAVFTAYGDWLADVGGLDAFAKRVEVTVAYENGAGVTDFPVLVRLSTSITGFSYDDLKSDGSDLVFALDDGTILPHEIDTWKTDGESLVWVRVPSIAKGEKFYAYYDNANVTSAPPSADFKNAAWNGYAGVWHMGEQFAANATIESKTAYDSTGNGLDATAKDTSSGQTKISQMVPYENGVIGTARVNQSSTSKLGAYLSVPSYDSLGMGGTFTFSGWYYANEIGSSKYPRPVSRKNGGSDANGWEMQVENGSSTKISTRGGGSTKATVTYPKSFTSGWHHYAWVFNGTTLHVYQDGVEVGSGYTINAATDNGKPLSFGCDSDGNEQCWNGQYDELRLNKSAVGGTYVSAECDVATNRQFLTYGEVQLTDVSAIGFSGSAVYSVNGDSVTFSVSANSGSGTLSAVYVDTATDAETVNAIQGFSGAGTYSDTPANLTVGKLYSVFFRGTSTGGSVTQSKPVKFYYGGVSVAKVSDANEAGFVAGSFTVTIAAAVTEDLEFAYSVGGTAAAGQAYAALPGSVTVPAGSTSAAIAVTPLLDIFTTADKTVSVTLAEGSFFLATDAAELTVFDDPAAVTDPTVRFVSTSGNDSANGLTESTSFKTVARAVEDLGATGGRVFIAAGTYTETNAFPSVQTGTETTNQYACVNLQAPVQLIGMTGNPADVTVKRSSQSARILYIDHADAVVRDLTISGGVGTSGSPGGGAVYITPAGGTISHCIIEKGNSDSGGAWDAGGGNIYMEGGLVERSIIRNGKSKSHGSGRNGGGAYMTGGIIENCLIYANTCANGASVVINGPGRLVNCTVTGHSAGSVAGVKASATAAVLNCAIFGNTCTSDSTGHGHVWANKADGFDHCAGEVQINDRCVTALSGGFIDPDNGDYSLTPASICLDNGLSYEATGAKSDKDLSGNPRVSGVAVDIGAYEYQQTGLDVAFTADKLADLCSATVNFTATILGHGGSYTCYWDFDGDGNDDYSAENTVVAAHQYAAAGRFSVKLRVSAAAGEKAFTLPEPIFIAPQVLYVDSANAENAAYPYDTPGTASTSIPDAVAAAYDGSTIFVADGVYGYNTYIEIRHDIRLLSASGDPSRCMISNTLNMAYGGTPSRNVLLDSPNALLAGFTLAKGYVDQVSGAAVHVGYGGGTVSNCVITSASMVNYYGRSAVAMDGGRITRCTISRCLKSDDDNRVHYGCAIDLTSGATADNCLIYDCGSLLANSIVNVGDNCTVRNLTVVNCLVPENRYGINATSKAKVYNCVVAGVTTTYTPAAEEPTEENPNPATPDPVTETRAWGGTAASFANCAFDQACDGGVNCIEGTASEFFKDYANGKFMPKGDGKLLNAGNDANLGGATIDLAGKPRVFGKHSDIGCFECQSSGFGVVLR